VAKNQDGYRVKLFGGKQTAEEVYAQAINKPCNGCGGVGITQIATLLSVKDLYLKRPDIIGAMMAASDSGQSLPIIKTIYGPMVCVGEVTACKRCTPEAERAASAGERKWSAQGYTVQVEIRRGPPPDRPIFQVPKGDAE